MIVLPIAERELRVAARKPVTYRIRFWSALIAVGILAWKLISYAAFGVQESVQGNYIFNILSTVAFVYCLFIGARTTADCLSEEKREGTLGLLFLTDLKGKDVVFGKLVASSVNSVYGLLAILPMLAVPLLLGGVNFRQFGETVLTLLNTIFFSLCVGLLISAISRHERKSLFATLLVLAGSTFLPLAIIFTLLVFDRVQVPQDAAIVVLLLPSPGYSFACILVPRTLFLTLPAWSFWASLAAVQLMGWGCLLLAARILPRIWKDKPKKPQAPTPSEQWEQFSFGNPAERLAYRRRLLRLNPFLWLAARDRLKPAYVWFFLLTVIAIWSWGYLNNRDVMFDFYPLAPTIIMVHGFVKLWVTSEVCHRLVEDQRAGALELLLSTPLQAPQILEGQKMALRRQFFKPVAVLFVIEWMLFWGHYPFSVLFFIQAMFVADIVTLKWVGMWLSLSSRTVNRVFLTSFGLVLILPFAVQQLIVNLWQNLSRHYIFDQPGFETKMALWFVIGLANNLVWGLFWARPRLLRNFRGAVLGAVAGKFDPAAARG